MKYMTCPIEAFLPTQPTVTRKGVDLYKRLIAAGHDFSVEAVPLKDGVYDRELIGTQGHHRAYAYHELGATTLSFEIFDRDEDITKIHFGDMRSLQDVRSRYWNIWLPGMQKEGGKIFRVASLRVKN